MQIGKRYVRIQCICKDVSLNRKNTSAKSHDESMADAAKNKKSGQL